MIVGLLLLTLAASNAYASCEANQELKSWGKTARGKFQFTVPESTRDGWTIVVTFDKPVEKLKVWKGIGYGCSGSKCVFGAKDKNKALTAGSTMIMQYKVWFQDKPVGTVVSIQMSSTSFSDVELCGGAESSQPQMQLLDSRYVLIDFKNEFHYNTSFFDVN